MVCSRNRGGTGGWLLGLLLLLASAGGGMVWFRGAERWFGSGGGPAIEPFDAATDVARALPANMSPEFAFRVSDVRAVKNALLTVASLDGVQRRLPGGAGSRTAMARGLIAALPVRGVAMAGWKGGRYCVAVDPEESQRGLLDLLENGRPTSLPLLGIISPRRRNDGGGMALFVTQDDGKTVNLAARDGLLLLARDSRDVVAMLEALEGKSPALSLPPSPNAARVSLPLADMLKDARVKPEELGMEPPGDRRFTCVLSLRRESGVWAGEVSMDLASFFRSENFALVQPLARQMDEPASLGGGRVIAEYAMPLNLFALAEQALRRGRTDAAAFERDVRQKLDDAGLGDVSFEEMRSMLSGSLRFVFGVRARLALPGREKTEIPGFLMELHGRSACAESLAQKLLTVAQMRRVPLVRLEPRGGWAFVAGCTEPVPVTLAASGNTLVLGVFDPDTVGEAPERNPEITALFGEAGYYRVALDMRAIRSEVLRLLGGDSPVRRMVASSKGAEALDNLLSLLSLGEFLVVDQPEPERFRFFFKPAP